MVVQRHASAVRAFEHVVVRDDVLPVRPEEARPAALWLLAAEGPARLPARADVAHGRRDALVDLGSASGGRAALGCIREAEAK